MTTEVYFNIDAQRKNYLFISPEHDGRVHVQLERKTDDELGEVADYFEYNQISALSVGKSCTIYDGAAIVVRVA